MRRLLFLPSVVAVSLAGAAVYLALQLGWERERAQQAEARVAELESRLHSVDRARSVERETIAKAPTATVAPASTAPTTAKRSEAPDGSGGSAATTISEQDWQARMYRTPSSRALLRAERIARLKSQNPEIARRLGLTEAEAEDLLGFLADQELRRQAELRKRRQGGNFDFAASMAQEKRELAAKLGEERMQKYEAYRTGAPDRSQVRSFRARLGDSDMLTDAQAESLAAALQEEREQYAKEIKDEIGGQATFTMQSANGRALMTNNPTTDEDAQERQLIEQMETYTRRARERAATLLTAGQLKAFEEFQAAQLVSERLMLRSMRETDPAK